MADPKEIQLKVNFGTAAGLRWQGSGPRVLALHGWLDNANTFAPLGGQTPIDLVSLDLPGHGLSSHLPPGVFYHFVDYVADVMDVARALGWDRFHLMGHSLGGGVAAVFAGAFPELVESLVMIESLGPLSHPESEVPTRIAQHGRSRAALGEKRKPTYPDLEAAALARFKAGDLSLESSRILAKRGTEKVGGGITWRSDQRLKLPSPLRLSEPQVQACLRAITCPTLGIRAKAGLPWPEENVKTRLNCVKDLELVEVDGGHHVHLDHPNRVLPALTRFYSSK